eukprot:15366479-Ditylum_brightwellii.AAC.1
MKAISPQYLPQSLGQMQTQQSLLTANLKVLKKQKPGKLLICQKKYFTTLLYITDTTLDRHMINPLLFHRCPNNSIGRQTCLFLKQSLTLLSQMMSSASYNNFFFITAK